MMKSPEYDYDLETLDLDDIEEVGDFDSELSQIVENLRIRNAEEN